MLLFSWLRPRRSLLRPLPPRYRPRLEALEGRDVPSTLMVSSTNPLSSTGLPNVIRAAASGDTIVFAPSLAGQTIQLMSELNITKSLNIQGPGAGLLAIAPRLLSGERAAPRLFEIAANVSVTISGLTLENGGGTMFGYGSGNSGFVSYADDDDGGAILNFGTLTVSGCTLSSNSVIPIASYATYGGAIYNAGTLTLTGSTLAGNSACAVSQPNCAGRGGALYNSNTGTATLSGCTLTGNVAGKGYSCGVGGGIDNEGALTVTGCTVSGNTASYEGGGICNATFSSSVVNLSNDTIDSNTATTTAGVSGGGVGGGLFIGPVSTVTLTSDTVEFNTAATDGGGIYIASGAAVSLDAFTVANVINNTAHHDRNIAGSYRLA